MSQHPFDKCGTCGHQSREHVNGTGRWQHAENKGSELVENLQVHHARWRYWSLSAAEDRARDALLFVFPPEYSATEAHVLRQNRKLPKFVKLRDIEEGDLTQPAPCDFLTCPHLYASPIGEGGMSKSCSMLVSSNR